MEASRTGRGKRARPPLRARAPTRPAGENAAARFPRTPGQRWLPPRQCAGAFPRCDPSARPPQPSSRPRRDSAPPSQYQPRDRSARPKIARSVEARGQARNRKRVTEQDERTELPHRAVGECLDHANSMAALAWARSSPNRALSHSRSALVSHAACSGPSVRRARTTKPSSTAGRPSRRKSHCQPPARAAR